MVATRLASAKIPGALLEAAVAQTFSCHPRHGAWDAARGLATVKAGQHARSMILRLDGDSPDHLSVTTAGRQGSSSQIEDVHSQHDLSTCADTRETQRDEPCVDRKERR